jgi:peptidoglycan hydrolase-like protein with peptidoglycan-binding domain
MSLLITSGDPSRSALGADCATILNAAKAQTLYNNGYRYVGRYLTGTYGGGIDKALSLAEANIILNAGLRFFPIFQQGGDDVSYFTEQQGTSDAQTAIAAATALGIPQDTIIYFAVDFDAMDAEVTSTVIPYFRNVYAVMSASIYKTGIYGARNVCSRVAAAGYSSGSFVGDMATAFSGNLGYKIPDDWAFSQFANLVIGSGDGLLEIDKDAVSGRDQGVSHLDAFVLGDVNHDGNITSIDALMALQAASGRITLTNLQKNAADVNIDGSVTTIDALKILQYSSGRITHF